MRVPTAPGIGRGRLLRFRTPEVMLLPGVFIPVSHCAPGAGVLLYLGQLGRGRTRGFSCVGRFIR